MSKFVKLYAEIGAFYFMYLSIRKFKIKYWVAFFLVIVMVWKQQ